MPPKSPPKLMTQEVYKLAKEAFVSNLSGTSIKEIILITLPLPIALWAYTEIKALRLINAKPTLGLLSAFIYEWTLLIIPQVLAQCLPEATLWVLLILVVLAIICRTIVQASRDPVLKSQWRHDKAVRMAASHSRNYLSNYRAGVMLTSAIAILAVDFTIFPRRFGKTETFGTSLMDLGVGCFIFSSGFCSRAARLFHHHGETVPSAAAAAGVTGIVINKSYQSLASLSPRSAAAYTASAASTSNFRFSKRAAMWRTTKRCIPLLCLGLGRLLVNRKVDYQEHLSEYGVHWNFFLTLAVIQLLATALHTIFPHKALFPLSIILLVLYQMQLSVNGLTEYILTAPRDPESFMSQNREGICGILGFLCLYLVGEQIGTWTVWRMGVVGGGTKTTELEAKWALLQLLGLDAFLWGAMFASGMLVQPISRRLVNMAYVLWLAAYNLLVITLLFAVDEWASMTATSRLLAAVNRNQLAFFILANVITGIVNLSMYTIYAAPPVAWAVILTYLFTLMLVFLLLDRAFNVTLKFW